MSKITNVNAGTYNNLQITVNGCKSSTGINAVITDLIPPISPIATVVDPTCSKQTGSITVTSPVGSGLKYSIDGVNFNSSTLIDNLTNNNYTVTVKDLKNCTNTSQYTINTPPIVAKLVVNNPSTICEPNTINLLDPAITLGSTNIGNLFYYSDQNATTSISNPSAYNIAGTSTIYIKTTNTSNCSDVKPVTIKINPKDIITISNPSSLCSNSPLEKLTATPIGGSWTGSGITPSGDLQASTAKIGINDYMYTSSGICPNTKTVQIKINSKPYLKISRSDTVCEGELFKLLFVSPYSILKTCTWNFGDNITSNKLNEVSHSYSKAGEYDITLIGKDENECSDTLTMVKFIKVLERPKTNFTFTPEKPTIFNSTIQTTNLTLNATDYTWNFGDEKESNLTNPSHKYGNNPNTYFITLSAYNEITSCSHDTIMQIEVFDEVYCFIPNTFTPNGDEINNEFKPVLSGSVAEDHYSLYIYNRWGQLLFESHNKNVGWSGAFGNTICQPDTYIWKLEFRDTINKEKHMKSGHVNLVK